MDKNHKDPDTIDLNVLRRAQYLHNAWKRNQDAVYWVDINLAIEKKYWNSIKLDRMQSSFKEYFQLIVFQKLLFPRTETIRSHNSSAGKPSNLSPVSKEMISDSFEMWETAVCFLHIQLIGTNVWLPRTHNVPPEADFESSRSPAKSESWNSPSLHYWAVLPTWQYCLYSQVWWMYEINRFRRLSQALVHFVMDRASLFTDHRISCRSILAKYMLFRTIWEHTCDNSPTDFIASSLKWWSSMHGVDTLQSCWVVLFANSQYRSTHFFAWPAIS